MARVWRLATVERTERAAVAVLAAVDQTVWKRGLPAGVAAGGWGREAVLPRVGGCSGPACDLSSAAAKLVRNSAAAACRADRRSASRWRASCTHGRAPWLVSSGSGRGGRWRSRLRLSHEGLLRGCAVVAAFDRLTAAAGKRLAEAMGCSCAPR